MRVLAVAPYTIYMIIIYFILPIVDVSVWIHQCAGVGNQRGATQGRHVEDYENCPYSV